MTRRWVVPRSARFRTPAWKRTFALTLACASLAFPTDRALATDAAASASDPPPPVTRSTDSIRYRVVIDAPREFVDTLTQSVDLVRWQTYADMTDELLDRLARQAVDQAREAASTLGYFSANVDIAVDRSTDPFTVTLKVEPGPATRIAEVAIDVTGPAASDRGAGAAAIASLKEDWGLPKGEIFNQASWDSAKTRAVATLASSPYAAAALTSSEARIDPDAKTADLSVDIASGPPFRIGRIEVTGLRRYDASLVRNFSTQKRGDLYSGAELDQFLRRLNGTGYFASAHATIDTDLAQADDATVTVAVIEAPTRKLEAGVGFSTDTEFRVNANYRDVDIDGRGLQFLVDARIETLLQSGTLRFVQPPGPLGLGQQLPCAL